MFGLGVAGTSSIAVVFSKRQEKECWALLEAVTIMPALSTLLQPLILAIRTSYVPQSTVDVSETWLL